MKAARRRGALWVRPLDFARLALTGEGRSILWTRFAHRSEVHQTTPSTWGERYPALFDFAASLAPDPRRILSFGCSTGEELISLRRRFPAAEIVGAEINGRSRRIAGRLTAGDPKIHVVGPRSIDGVFDCVFALAVLQREPHKIEALEVNDLTAYYPFSKFDATLTELVNRLIKGGLLCVINAQYRAEDSSVAAELDPVDGAPPTENQLFGPDGKRVHTRNSSTIFRKTR